MFTITRPRIAHLGTAAVALALGLGAAGTAHADQASPAATSTTFTLAKNPIARDNPDTATVTVAGTHPTGTVTVTAVDTMGTDYTLGKGTVTDGTASIGFTIDGPSTYAVTAHYSGDSVNAASTSSATNLVVTFKGHAPIHWAFTPSTGTVGHTNTANVSVLPVNGLPTPTGRVQLVDLTGGKKVGLAARTLVDGHAALPYVPSATGTRTFFVVYSGDANYDNLSQSGRVTLVVK